jgi:hypothetical protein
MESYIRQYYDVLDKEFCKTLIEKFNECEGNQLSTLPKEGRQFTEITLMENMGVFEDEFDVCLNSFQNVIEKYKEDLCIRSINSEYSEGTSALWPEKYGMEGIKIKRYLDNDVDMFDWHVDVNDGQSNARFLAFFVYLDDNEAGSTEFADKEIDCVAGSALVFPPMWPWLHRGNKPIKKPKYLLQSYLHYLSSEELGEPSQWDVETVHRFWGANRKREAIDRLRDLHKKFPNSEQVNRLMEMIYEG